MPGELATGKLLSSEKLESQEVGKMLKLNQSQA
jgi:hypothetical protein